MKKYQELQNLIERADRLIRLKATGSPEEFAAKLGISRASVFRLLQYLKSVGTKIKYSKTGKVYFYE